MTTLRDPVRPVSRKFLAGLTLESTKVFPLAGGTGRRQDAQADPRLRGLVGQTLKGDEVTYYEHIATVRHTPTNTFFVAFRETMDAFLARQRDPSKFPEWLMKSPEKQAERKIYVYKVTRAPAAVMTSHEQWLEPLQDQDIRVFDAIAYFLHQNRVIDAAVYATLG
jgi:hypothetical protein